MKNRDSNADNGELDISEIDIVNYLLLFPTDVSEGFILQETGEFILVEDGSGGKLLIEE